jgi:hypothetical protein
MAMVIERALGFILNIRLSVVIDRIRACQTTKGLSRVLLNF